MTGGQSSFEVRVGSRVWLDGQGWDVAELDGAVVRLRTANTIRTVSLSTLARVMIDSPEPSQTPDAPGAWEIPSIVLAGLSRSQRESLAGRLEALRRVLEPDAKDDR